MRMPLWSVMPLVTLLLLGSRSAGAAEVVTPASLQAQISDGLAADPGSWSDFDIDGDGKISQLEVILCLARHPEWMRHHYPAAFDAIDTDHDGAISVAELTAFVQLLPPGRITVQPRLPSSAPQDVTSLQGFEDPPSRKHFDPVTGLVPRGTVLNADSAQLLVQQ